MSIPVDVADLAKALEGFGAGYLLTTTGGSVKVVTVEPTVTDGVVLVEAPGKGTAANLAENPAVTLVFPPRAAEGVHPPRRRHRGGGGRRRPHHARHGGAAPSRQPRRRSAGARRLWQRLRTATQHRMTPRWMTSFLDFPEEGYEAGADFWSAVTGYKRSAPRGDHDRVRDPGAPAGHRLPARPAGRLTRRPRIHLDLSVDDLGAAVDDAVGLGAGVVDRPYDDVTIMSSPGGFVFCLVPGQAGERPAPGSWPGRTSYVDQVCLDIPPSRYDDELAFWAAVTGWRRRDPAPGSEFGRLTPGPEQPLQLLLQRLDDEQNTVTAHLDWSASDHEAELAAHESAGAEVMARFEGWTVLRDPAGLTYCVTRRRPGDRPE